MLRPKKKRKAEESQALPSGDPSPGGLYVDDGATRISIDDESILDGIRSLSCLHEFIEKKFGFAPDRIITGNPLYPVNLTEHYFDELRNGVLFVGNASLVPVPCDLGGTGRIYYIAAERGCAKHLREVIAEDLGKHAEKVRVTFHHFTHKHIYDSTVEFSLETDEALLHVLRKEELSCDRPLEVTC